MEELVEIFKSIDMMAANCDIDYDELKSKKIDKAFFDDYQNVRIVNSFLFNYSKIQDKIGAKLLKKALYEAKEIEDETLPMRDVLNLLEKLRLIDSVDIWERLRETRNAISHEYPFYIEERTQNISLAMEGYVMLKNIYKNIKDYTAGVFR